MKSIIDSNAKLLLRDLEKRCIPIDANTKKLVEFTLAPNQSVDNINGTYYWPYKGKKIPFQLLSDKNIREYDKRILKDNNKRNIFETIRSLRIAGSHLLNDATYLTVIANNVRSLVRFKKDNDDYIIDYANNLIMKDSDYKQLFPYQIVEELSQCDLAYLDDIMKGDYRTLPLEIFLLSFSEIKKELTSKDARFMPKYDEGGINGQNKFIFDQQTETLFWLDDDYYSDYNDDANKLSDFTLNPSEALLDTSKKDKKYYKYKNYLFRLYSDMIVGDDLKEKLLSDKRFGYCFDKAIDVAFSLGLSLPEENVRIVLGKVYVTEEEYFYHAWVEYQARKSKKWYAVDYTGNIVIERDAYIKLKKAKVENVLSLANLQKIYEYFNELKPHIEKYLVLYLGNEMLRDLEKNKSLFKKVH